MSTKDTPYEDIRSSTRCHVLDWLETACEATVIGIVIGIEIDYHCALGWHTTAPPEAP